MSDRLTIKFNVEEQTLEMNEVIRFNVGGVELHLDKDSGILSLLDSKGNILSEVDFPTEKIITSAYYDNETKELVIEFENANAVRIPITNNLENFEVGTSENYNVESDEQLITPKAVKKIVDSTINIAIENAITTVLNEEV